MTLIHIVTTINLDEIAAAMTLNHIVSTMTLDAILAFIIPLVALLTSSTLM
jgi:hypothetical protein